ncbi:effector-associated constant component EACC1 [Nocardia sp. NPDC003183]
MPIPNGQFSIHTDGGSEAAEQLLDWLSDDDALRGRVRFDPASIREGDMGGVTEILTIALGSGVAGVTVTALARSLTTWLTHRRSDLTVTLTRADGESVKITGKRLDSDTVLRRIQDLTRPVDPRQ